MGGTNPYIKAPDVRLPDEEVQITFVESGETVVEVDPRRYRTAVPVCPEASSTSR